jgi:uncharacterized protein (TIGR01244 family)
MDRCLASLCLALLLTACSTPSRPRPDPAPALTGFALQSGGIYTGGRVTEADMPRLKQAGVRRIIDLSVDAETPDFDEAAVAAASGLGYANLPFANADALSRENVQAFDALLGSGDAPVLVHCGSGNRVGAMAALRAAWIDGKSTEEAIAIGRAWGLKGLEAEVRARLDTALPR